MMPAKGGAPEVIATKPAPQISALVAQKRSEGYIQRQLFPAAEQTSHSFEIIIAKWCTK